MKIRDQFKKRPGALFLLIAMPLFLFHISAGAQDQAPPAISPVVVPPERSADLGTDSGTTPTTDPATGAGGPVTPTQASQDLTECTEDMNDAKNACSQPQSTAGMNPQQAAQMQQMQQQAQAANSATAATTQQQAEQEAELCRLQADLSAALGAMSALKGNACGGTVSTCTKSCTKAQSDYQNLLQNKPLDTNVPGWRTMMGSAKSYASKCSGLGGNSSNMMQAAGALLGGMLQNLMCDQITATASPTPTNVGSCSDPTFAATSVLCVCQNDPKNAMCTAPQQFPSGLTTTAGDLGTTAPPQGTADDGSDGQLVKADNSKPDDARGSATTGDGGGGGGGLQSPRANPLNPTGDDRPPGSNVDKSVITGTMGGSGGASGGGGGGGGGAAANQRGGGGSGKGFDLSKFLPKAATRNIAGMTLSAKDGITGPMGPSIWEKVSNQYQLQKPNLIPEQQ